MIKVMSFNLRYGTAEDGINSWNSRRTMALDRIHAFGPDLLGVQECQAAEQLEYVQQHMPGYGCAGVARGGSGPWPAKLVNPADLEMTAVFYRLAMFTLVEQATFWLSKTPAVAGSKSWGSMYPRTVTWVRLQSRQPPFAELCFFNTHFDHFSWKARREAAKMVCAQMLTKAAVPMIVVGDFNTLKDYGTYNTFVDAGFRDAYRQLHAPGRKQEGSFHDYGRTAPMAIDWIFVSKQFEVVEAAIDRFHAGDSYPSDHYPVTAVLRCPHQGSPADQAAGTAPDC